MAEFNVENLFNAKKFVVIGASDKPGPGLGSTKGIAQSLPPVKVYYVNPNREELFGQRCYKSLSEIEDDIDCAAIATSAKLVNEYLEEIGKKGIKAAIIYASGFSEEGNQEGKEREKESRAICEKYGITVCGPNCMGVINNTEMMSSYGAIHVFPEKPVKRGMAVVAQSGYINSYFMRTYPDLVAYGASIGNGVTSSLEDFLLYYSTNEKVSVIAAYMEGIRDASKLEQALRNAAMSRKPVVVLKSGRSKKGATAAASHTGNLAGDFASFESVFNRFGVICVDNLEEFSVTAKLFAMIDGKIPDKAVFGSINFSGGENTLCADFFEKNGLEFAQLSQSTLDKITELIPAYSTASNPLDPTTTMFSQEEKVQKLFEALAEDDEVTIISLGDDLSEKSEPKDITCANVLTKLTSNNNFPPTVVVPSFEKNRNIELKSVFEKAGVAVLSSGDLGYRELRNLQNFINYDYREHTLELSVPENNHFGQETLNLSEDESKTELVQATGIRIPKQVKVSEISDLNKSLEKIEYPVVMKVDSPDILHKTEAGGVVVGIRNVEEAQEIFDKIMSSCRKYKPEAKINGVLVQEMVKPGTEVIVGIINDIQMGPMIMLGLGGIFTEVFKDVKMCPCPISASEAKAMINSLKGAKLFNGYRGSKPLDTEMLADFCEKLSVYAAENKDSIKEIDINPIVVFPEGEGITALDGLIIKYK